MRPGQYDWCIELAAGHGEHSIADHLAQLLLGAVAVAAVLWETARSHEHVRARRKPEPGQGPTSNDVTIEHHG